MKRRMLRKSPVILLTAAVILLGSCLKTVSNNNNNNPAYVSFINMAPGAPSFTVKLDNNIMGNDSTFPYAGYKQVDTVTKALYYTNLFAGIHSISFTDSVGDILVGGQAQFANNIKYSVYLFDTLTSLGLQAVQLQDSPDSIPRNYATLRFLNFCPVISPVDMYVYEAGDSITVIPRNYYAGSGNVSATTLSKYTLPLAPGTYLFKFAVSGTPMLSIFDSLQVTVSAGKVYSLFLTGLPDSAGSKALTAGVIHMN